MCAHTTKEGLSMQIQMKENTIAWTNLGCYAFKTGRGQVI